MAPATASGRSSWTAWPVPSTITSCAFGSRCEHRFGDAAELLVALADDQRDRDRQLRQALPERLHHAGPEAAQRGRQPGRRVAQAIGVRARGDPLRLAGEQRLRAPFAREGLDVERLDAARPARRRPRGAPPAPPDRRAPGSRPPARAA